MRCVLITVFLFFVPCLLLVLAAFGSAADDNGNSYVTEATNGSCYNRCGDETGTQQCRCDVACTAETCCSDYESVCFSCTNRCTDSVHVNAPCQCDSRCGDQPPADDCCDDYDAICNSVTVVGNVTDEELKLLTEELSALDVNNGAPYITLEFQGNTTQSDTDDVAPDPLFTFVEEDAFSSLTVQLYEVLRDNYFLQVSDEEVVTTEEMAEVTAFLDAVMGTSVMQRLEEFLMEHDVLNGSLRESLEQIWFTLYSRSGTVIDSSGFEHVFIGELDGGTVGGFHDWISFYREEVAGALNYQGYIEKSSLEQAGYVLTNRFTWHNTSKPIGGGLVGPSPEFQMALYSLCFYVRPNSICSVQVNGVPFDVQTYDYNGEELVASAYPIVVS